VHLADHAALLLGREPHLGTVLRRLADVFGDRPLVTQEADERTGVAALSLTYREAADEVDRLAARIAAAASPGDRVVVAVPNGYRFLLLTLAASRAGCTTEPVNPLMTSGEVEHVVADCGASLVIRGEDDLPPAAAGEVPWPSADPGDVAALFYTSGTTGKPKGVRLTHRSLVGGIRGLGLPRWLRQDEAVIALPAAHIYGFIGYLGLAGAGVAAYALPRFNPVKVLDAIERRRPTAFLGVPAMYRLLLEAGAEQRDLKSIRVWACGADAMPDDLARAFQRMGASATLPVIGPIGEALFVEGYGMVELGGGCAVKVRAPLVGGLGAAGGVGVPVPGWSLKVDAPPGQVGELLVKGPGMMKGYYGAEEATAKVLTPDGWLRTGDLARQGPFGLISFAGRQKDVIKSGGYSVYALEVEQALEECEGVAEAAAVGLPDERKGERVAVAVRRVEGSDLGEDELLAFARERLSAYKVPERVLFVDDLPRTGTEKVQRSQVKALFTQGA
jgi:acyl-CoA synthetase (AMP-forming)/AMP-acid ligase II